MAQNKPKQKKEKNRKGYKFLWKLFALCWLAVIVFFAMLSWGWIGFMPSFEELENPKSNLATEVYSSDGEILGFIGVENRSNVYFSDLSPNLVNALIATEDVRFYEHSGIDFRSLLRVLGKTIIGGDRGSGGGSTITQQLAKNLFPRERKSGLGLLHSKFKEWVVAVKLEHNYSKTEILSMYLNTVDFGSNSFGIKTAAKTFFAKTPATLTVEEAATLVGLLKAPTSYSPVLNPENSKRRRNVVMSQMVKAGFLTQEEYDEKKEKPINMTKYLPQTHNDGTATYLREYVRTYMKDWCKKHKKPDGEYYDVHKDGLRVYTTIDSRMQRYAEAAVAEHLGKDLQPAFFKEMKGRKNAPFVDITTEQIDTYMRQAMKQSDRYRALKDQGMTEKEIRKAFDEKVKMRVFTWRGVRDTVMSPWDSLRYYKSFLHTGLMSVEPGTGHVKAYVGGINYRYFKYDNVTQGRRQVGSTFKPFVYTMAMQDGSFTPCSQVPNSEVCFENADGTDWCPKNSTDECQDEMVTLKWALANSVNYVSAYLMKQGSPEVVIELARRMGIKAPIDPVPAICLGTPDISVYEMAGAMATYANKGEYVEPIIITRIEDNKGMVLERFVPNRNEAIDEQTAYMMIELMKGVVSSGTGVRLRYKYGLNYPIAGKTGTTQNNSDGWFIGITPKLATAVWVGGELRSIHFRSMAHGQGANAALPIWALYMKKVYDDKTINFYKGDFNKPSVPLDVEMDCDKYQEEIQVGNDYYSF
ncbi:MAG: transglycosylase domain-containing protein [Bacteroidales bacterium]|nr:transglycosylase domain-containing protein [Bacteroidales bacterium]